MRFALVREYATHVDPLPVVFDDIFVNFDPSARPLAPTMSKLEPYMAGYDLDAMVTIAPEVTADPVPWNWKMLLENYIEPYHTQFVHPIIHDFAPSTGVEFDGWRGPDDNVIVRYVPFLERDGSLTDKGWAAPALFPIIESLSEKQRNRVGFGMVPPNMYIIFMPLARRLMIVTKKLTAAASEATPRTCRPTVQKSMLRPGENCLLVRLA